jgi:hypothetical protein
VLIRRRVELHVYRHRPGDSLSINGVVVAIKRPIAERMEGLSNSKSASSAYATAASVEMPRSVHSHVVPIGERQSGSVFVACDL